MSNCTEAVNWIKFQQDIVLMNFQYIITDAQTRAWTAQKQNASGIVLTVAEA